ncbi:uncharacterized protein [Clytia hemisphaerica]|uniref:Cnidarian restricted protein n=2 Tax=Clytia hemisphaerica TaxID=252671 RepID=A0A7M5VGF5_9CNID
MVVRRQGYLLLFVVVVKLCQSVPITTTTQQPITNRPHKDCFPSGFEFAYDDVIDHGNFPNGETCWQITCGPSGRLIKSLTPCEKVMTQRKPTAKPSEEKQVENQCIFNGRKFNPGEDIQTLSDWQSDRCYGTRCSKDGTIVAWENINCYSTPYYSTTEKGGSVQTPEFITTPSHVELSTTEASGCYENSVTYQPGEEISFQYFTENQTCCGRYCNYSNKIVSWEKSECEQGKSTVEPTSQITTFGSTTDTDQGCYTNGRAYKPGVHIDSGNDGSSWCFGRYCNENSVIVYWDDFHCDVKSSKKPSLIISKYDFTKTPMTSEYDVTKQPVTSTSDLTTTLITSTKFDEISTLDPNHLSTSSGGLSTTTEEEVRTEQPPVEGSLWEQLQFLVKNKLYSTVVEDSGLTKSKDGKYQVKLSIFKKKS